MLLGTCMMEHMYSSGYMLICFEYFIQLSLKFTIGGSTAVKVKMVKWRKIISIVFKRHVISIQ